MARRGAVECRQVHPPGAPDIRDCEYNRAANERSDDGTRLSTPAGFKNRGSIAVAAPGDIHLSAPGPADRGTQVNAEEHAPIIGGCLSLAAEPDDEQALRRERRRRGGRRERRRRGGRRERRRRGGRRERRRRGGRRKRRRRSGRRKRRRRSGRRERRRGGRRERRDRGCRRRLGYSRANQLRCYGLDRRPRSRDRRVDALFLGIHSRRSRRSSRDHRSIRW